MLAFFVNLRHYVGLRVSLFLALQPTHSMLACASHVSALYKSYFVVNTLDFVVYVHVHWHLPFLEFHFFQCPMLLRQGLHPLWLGLPQVPRQLSLKDGQLYRHNVLLQLCQGSNRKSPNRPEETAPRTIQDEFRTLQRSACTESYTSASLYMNMMALPLTSQSQLCTLFFLSLWTSHLPNWSHLSQSMHYFLLAYTSNAGWLLWDALGGKQAQQQGCRNGTGQTVWSCDRCICDEELAEILQWWWKWCVRVSCAFS